MPETCSTDEFTPCDAALEGVEVVGIAEGTEVTCPDCERSWFAGYLNLNGRYRTLIWMPEENWYSYLAYVEHLEAAEAG